MAAGSGGHDGQAVRHRLEDAEPESLDGARCEQDGGAAHELVDVRPGAEELDVPTEPLVRDELLERGTL
ncbi:hypothetical protein D3C74_480060 [compost metagenome]